MIYGIGMVRDEADIIKPVVQHMAKHVDRLIVADNNSTDGTRDLLADLTRDVPLTVLEDPEIGYYQSQKMTAIAHRAGSEGATWIVPFDADEWWYTRFHDRIGDLLAGLAPQWLTASAELYDHVATSKDDPGIDDPTRRICWRRPDPVPLPKVACRYRPDLVIEQGNHGAQYDGGTTAFGSHLVIRHFPYRSPRQFVRKAKNGAEAYAATDLPEDVGAHWRQYAAIAETSGDGALEDVFHEWFHSDDPAEDGLIHDPARRSAP